MTMLCKELKTNLVIDSESIVPVADMVQDDLPEISVLEKYSPKLIDVLRLPIDPRTPGFFVVYAHSTDQPITVSVTDDSTWRAADNPASNVFNWTNLLGYPGTDGGSGAAILNLHLTVAFKGRDTGRVKQAAPWMRISKAPPYGDLFGLNGISGTTINWSDGVTEHVSDALFYAWAPDTRSDDNLNHPQNPACMLITRR